MDSKKIVNKNGGRLGLLLGTLCFVMLVTTGGSVFADDSPTESCMHYQLLQCKIPSSLAFCGERVPLEKRDVWERLDREFLLALGREAQVILWLKRSRRFFPLIEQKLKNDNLPDDLKYLAVAESDLYRYALSPKGAAGTWQFMEHTGKRFGLENHRWMDERYSFPKATDAALRYLTFLYEQFGQWTLAVAAYNCGEMRLKKEIEEQKTEDFFELNLPLETEEYLLRIMAIKVILSEPEKYGFVLEESDYYQPLDVQSVVVDAPGLVHIRIVAEAAQTTFKAIKELNPELKGNYLPEGSHNLFIPSENARDFAERFKLKLAKAQKGKTMFYRVKIGDSLSMIALKCRVSMEKLMELNNITKPNMIYPGQKIYYNRPVWD